MTIPVLQTEHLRKAYGALTVTDDVSLDLHFAELHAIIGPNGAGKTTFIHQLAGSLRPDAGQILFNRQDITNMPMAERVQLGLARTFQITSVLSGFTVLENAALAVQARAGSSFRFFKSAAHERSLNDKAMAALETVGLADRAERRASELSHGEKRQLELGDRPRDRTQGPPPG